jgi:hypothetical protein
MATITTFDEYQVGPKLFRGYYETQYTFADLTAAASTENLTHPKQEPNQSIIAQRLMVTDYISGGSISGCTIALGSAASVGAHLTALNAFATTTLGEWNYDAAGAGIEGGGLGIAPFVAAGNAICRVAASSDDVDQATAGAWTVGTWYERVAD